jgi:Major Facilitator Superfamily
MTALEVDQTEPRPAAYLSFVEARRIILGILLAMFLAALNQTIVATALPTIGRDLNDFENLSWTVTAYLLTSTIVASLYGKLSDIHGRRAMMLTAIGVFMAGSAICAVAPNMLTLVVGRGLQGLGGGGIMPLAQVIIADVCPPRERGRYQAYIGVGWVGAGIGGPVFGGFVAEHLHWSMIFWINVPLGFIAALLTNAALKRLPRNDRWHELDVLGAGLMMAAASALLLALTWGGTRYPWLSPQILSLFSLAVAFTAAFVWRISHTAESDLAESGRPDGRRGECLCGRRLDRSHRLCAVLLRARPQAVGKRFGARPHSHCGNDHAGIDHGRSRDDVHASLQAASARLPVDRDRRHNLPRRLSGIVALRRDGGAVVGRHWRRQCLSALHRLHPELRAAAPDGHRHRRDEFFSRAGERARCRDHGRDRARWLRRRAGARPGRRSHPCGGYGGRVPRLSLGFRGRSRIPCDRARGPDPPAGASAAGRIGEGAVTW